ncbi:hypothetical protein ACI65C_009715, partial [Semiaphis heraclei]
DSGLYNIMFFLQFNETVFKEKVRSKMENQNDHQINQNDQNHHDEPDKNNDQSIKDDIASNNDHQIDQNDQNHHDEPDENNDQSIKDDIASYLESCYREFNNDQNTMTLCKDLAKTPKEFCTSSTTDSVATVQRDFRRDFVTEAPTAQSIRRWHQTFQDSGCLCAQIRTG